VSRSSVYYHPQQPSAEEIAIKHRIDEIYTAYPFYGSRKIEAQLRRERVVINRKTVQRQMREMGIDITYIRMLKGWMYLVAIVDWYSRYVGSPGTRSHARDAFCHHGC
jgi:putative transposase